MRTPKGKKSAPCVADHVYLDLMPCVGKFSFAKGGIGGGERLGARLLEGIFGAQTPMLQFVLANIRKIAHFLEYSMLGIETVLLTFLARPISGQGVFNCTALGLMAATIDESIQIFAGRGAMVQDILLDMSGFLLAGGIALGILIIARRIRGKSVKEKNL